MAAADVTGQRSTARSSSSGSRRLDNPASAFVPDNALGGCSADGSTSFFPEVVPPASMQSSTAHARMLGKFSGNIRRLPGEVRGDGALQSTPRGRSRHPCLSRHWHFPVRRWLVPPRDSQHAKPERGKTSFSTAKIGSLLRSTTGNDCFEGLFHKNMVRNSITRVRARKPAIGGFTFKSKDQIIMSSSI